MRILPLAFLALLASPALADDAAYPVLPDTPSGLGDPDAIVCRAPQPLAGSGVLGPKICIHNSVWARLSLTGQDLSADGKSVFARPTVNDPTGDGNPDSVTCRAPVALTASRTWPPGSCASTAPEKSSARARTARLRWGPYPMPSSNAHRRCEQAHGLNAHIAFIHPAARNLIHASAPKHKSRLPVRHTRCLKRQHCDVLQCNKID